MKRIICIICCLIATISFAQKKVAVYVTSSAPIEVSIQKIVGSELTSAIVATKQYTAVERTTEFLSKISQEQQYQQTGAVDDQQISNIGKQFGVDLVSVVDITPFKDSYYIQARLIDVEKAIVTATARETSSLDEMPTIIAVSQKLAENLLGIEKVTYTKEYSFCLSQPNRCQIRRIEVNARFTEVYVTYEVQNTSWITINEATFIIDDAANTKYKLVKAEGVDVYPKKTMLAPSTISHDFVLYFEPIPQSVSKIDIIENTAEGTGWVWKGIKLLPYGEPNLYVFQVTPIEERVAPVQTTPTYTPTQKYSSWLTATQGFTIEKIITTDNFTEVYCRYQAAPHTPHDAYITASEQMYIVDENTQRKYMIRKADGIAVEPNVTKLFATIPVKFVLYFERVPLSVKTISIVQPDNRTRLQKLSDSNIPIFLNCKSISLFHYSRAGEYRFKEKYY